MKINIKPGCGNSPKIETIKNLTIYFASYDLEKMQAYFDDNICWTLVGNEPIIGKENFIAALREMSDNKASELTITSILTHGKEGAIQGIMKMDDGNEFGFADFYEFTSAGAKKVKSITSYVLQYP
ncbi:MAG: nuclear transport factor 2 family protein [Saprospiraceae bacterium]|nr:nuclear transport factor 2 family protein [Saprospiraceae bacterium]